MSKPTRRATALALAVLLTGGLAGSVTGCAADQGTSGGSQESLPAAGSDGGAGSDSTAGSDSGTGQDSGASKDTGSGQDAGAGDQPTTDSGSDNGSGSGTSGDDGSTGSNGTSGSGDGGGGSDGGSDGGGQGATSGDKGSGFAIGTPYSGTCTLAGVAPVTTSTTTQLTLQCSGLPSEYLLAVVVVNDPNLGINPSTGDMKVKGVVVDFAKSQMGMTMPVIQASSFTK